MKCQNRAAAVAFAMVLLTIASPARPEAPTSRITVAYEEPTDASLRCSQAGEGDVGVRQRMRLVVRPQRDPSGEIEELARVVAGEVGNAAQAALPP